MLPSPNALKGWTGSNLKAGCWWAGRHRPLHCLGNQWHIILRTKKKGVPVNSLLLFQVRGSQSFLSHVPSEVWSSSLCLNSLLRPRNVITTHPSNPEWKLSLKACHDCMQTPYWEGNIPQTQDGRAVPNNVISEHIQKPWHLETWTAQLFFMPLVKTQTHVWMSLAISFMFTHASWSCIQLSSESLWTTIVDTRPIAMARHRKWSTAFDTNMSRMLMRMEPGAFSP